MTHRLDSGRILVTGGAGFIGSALVWALNQRGLDDVVVTDVLGTSDKWRNLVPLRIRDYLEADDLLALLRATPAWLDDVRTVFHLGAISATTERDASLLIRNNVDYTKTLAQWALARDVRFVYASSAATYGDGSAGMSDAADLATLRPRNAYGFSKHQLDRWAARHGVLDRAVGLKYFNVFGPNEAHKGDMRSVVAKAYEQIVATGRVRLFKSHRPDYRDGEQRRDFVYVKDAVAATLHLAESGAHGLFNVGTGTAHTWLELVTPIFAAMGRPAAIDFVDMPEALRAGYQYHTQADVGRLGGTGWREAPTPLADAVTEYVRDHLVPDRRLGD
jgi:ADP-L-glycero-D-manno-heptose 6-epimerase